MAQYDACRNLSSSSADEIPYLLDVQSVAFDTSRFRLTVPLVPLDALAVVEPRLNPTFDIDGQAFAMLPLDLVSVPLAMVGEVRARLASDSDRILAALDLVLART